MPKNGFYRERDLISPDANGRRIFPGGHSSLWRFVAEGRFPPPVKLSQKITAWRSEDVEAWIQTQGGES